VVCERCGGTGMIKRPVVYKDIIFERGRYLDSELIFEAVGQREKIGGEDACPDCARRAEIEFNGRT